jgi:hypothetical protein
MPDEIINKEIEIDIILKPKENKEEFDIKKSNDAKTILAGLQIKKRDSFSTQSTSS